MGRAFLEWEVEEREGSLWMQDSRYKIEDSIFDI
jgi:hypothetical protein